MSRRCPVAAISVAKGCAIASVTLLTISSASPAIAQETAGLASPSAFRVCADPHDLPFSDTQGDGFENKIAELVAHDLKLPVQYTFFPDSQGFVRATLLKDRCDVIMGIAVGAGDITTTSAYYHTGDMMVTRDADHITANTVGEPALAGKQFGLIGGTPPTNLLVAHDLMDQTHLYDLMIDTRVEQPAHTMLTDLVAKRIDVGLLWGPFAGYYIKHDHLPLHTVFSAQAEPDHRTRAAANYQDFTGLRDPPARRAGTPNPSAIERRVRTARLSVSQGYASCDATWPG
jgi:quinoprotein dehydrogenase-associated probable ABC transporter substrate-binding protein